VTVPVDVMRNAHYAALITFTVKKCNTILSAIVYIGVARLFRGWVHPGMDLVAGTMEGRRPRARRGMREAPRGVRSGEERRSPSPVWGSGDIAPENCWDLTCKSVYFDAFLRLCLRR